MPPRTPSFLDQFILHLAAHLLGVDTVLENLQQTNPSNKKNKDTTVTLFYWRTKLLLDDPSCLLNGTYADADEASTLFSDLKISWNTKQPGLVLQWGAMILRQPCCTYIQSVPLTIEQLESHAQSVGLDLYSAPASAMAQAMGRALLVPHTNAPKVTMESPQKFQIQLYYPDVQETGTLNLDVLHQTSQFDGVGMSLLYWDLTSRVPPPRSQVVPSSSNSEQDQTTNRLQESLNKWCLAADLEMAKPSDASLSALLDNKSSSSSDQKNEDAATANKPRPVPGYAQLSRAKRRKKGKLSYAKPV
jgi:hypothetical protein